MATRKRFTRALLLRLGAVGLFVCLGTFAVMHSIQKQNKNPEVASTNDVNKHENGENEEPKPDPLFENKDKVKQVSAIDDKDSTSASKVPPPRFQPPSSGNGSFDTSGISNSTSRLRPAGPGAFSTGSSSDKNSSTAPAFEPSNSLTSGNSPTTSNRPVTPPLRTSSAQQERATTQAELPKRPVSQKPSTGGSFDGKQAQQSSSKSLMPPIRTGGTGFDSTRTPESTANTEMATTGTPNPRAPSVRQTMPPPSTRTGFQVDSATTQPSTRPPLNPSSIGIRNTSSTGDFNPASSSGSITNPSTLTPGRRQESPFPGNSGANTAGANTGSGSPFPPIRPETRQNAVASNPPPGTSNQQFTIPPASRATQASNNLPVRNASAPILQQPSTTRTRSALASAPITGVTRSSIAQPTPGGAEFEGVQIPALAVQKIAPREIQVNREAVFELVVKNTGRASAKNVQVHDFVPEGTRLVETTPSASPGTGGQMTWDLGTLAPGQQSSIKMKVLPQRPGNIGSVAHVTFGAQASARTVCTQPKLAIRHEAPPTVLLGQNLVMNIFVENKGNGAAENVVLQEDVPEGLEFSGGQRELEYEIGTLRPGETRRVQLPLRAAKVGQARNILVAHGEGKLRANDSVDIRVIAPRLAVKSEGPSRKFLNRKATHTFSVANQGTAAATNLQMVAQLPRGLQFVNANNQGQYDRTNHAVVWRLARLEPQNTGAVELTTMPVATGNQEIKITTNADLKQREETVQALVVQQLSELFFDIDDSADAIEVGSGTTYRVRVVNQGRIPATNVRVQVDFAATIQPVSVEGGVRNQIRGQSVVLDPIPSMQPGQEITFVINGKAMQAGEHRTVVSVRSDDREIAVSKEESTHVYTDR